MSFKNIISGSGQPQIVREPLMKIKIKLPSLEEQLRFEKIINSFVKHKLLSGYPEGIFKPDNIITKSEVITILNRISGINTKDVTFVSFNDLQKSHWAYNDICSAVIRK